ncbi:aldehyde dehydrogenase [Paraburkholderia sp. BL25I1N1]|uniref:aldehyde dehydrogenase family protein n=1 Tax=Paraburkholderia sp. BL25I1N1 TaxID=1938804 RepID=UPI000D04AC8D|nr:aldehyde dehydrogenase family protein [Paraburkholderia sp. BL25I1N1]PRX96456.1 aldehyde dehydrogenase (NAD+) [Paraburkholderia sp. BL25I1N1]
MREERHYINGKSVAPAGGQFLDVVSPATGEKIARVARGNVIDVDLAVKAAQDALEEWRGRRPLQRGRVLMSIADMLRRRRQEFIEMERAETGKALEQAAGEIETSIQYFEFYGGLVNAVNGETINLGDGYHSYTRREPYGVVGTILPWNAPLNQAARAGAPALAAGNTVVAKPSEATSTTLLWMARAAVEECGLPPGVFNVVTGLGPEAGAAIVKHPLVRKVAFTGSVRGGLEVSRLAAERALPLTLELGGKSPNIIFEDADLAIAVPGALRAFTVNSGQICVAGTRILVQRSIYDEFINQIREAAAHLEVGCTTTANLGPVTTQAQYDKVKSYYEVAKADGAVTVFGGKLPERGEYGSPGGWFVTPTLYADVSNDMRVAREEVFGPVGCVIPFDKESDAIRIANDTDFGLAAGIWTKDLARAHRVAAQIEAGQIYINEYMSGGVETPLGGYKLSGYGREKGIEALHHYTHLKCVTVKLS